MIRVRYQVINMFLTLAYFLTLFLATGGINKDGFREDEIRDIEKFAGDVMGCANIPGLAIGIVRGNSTFSTGLGVANMATGQVADKKTLFNLGSTAKALVPYVIAEVMNGKENKYGRINWSSTLKELLGHHSDIDLPTSWSEIMLKDMLVHKSGGSAADLTTMVGVADSVTREDILRRLRFLPNTTAFQNSNHHSNILYTIAGHLAERVSGMSWKELIKVKVLDRLSMNMTSFAPESMSLEEAALSYRFQTTKSGDPFVEQSTSLFDLRPFVPAGSLMTSAEDFTKWLHHVVHNLHTEGNDSGINMLIRDAFHTWVTLSESHREGVVRHESEVAIGYGMGWYSSTYRGLRRFKFSGSMYGYGSQILLFPDAVSAIFVGMNGPGTDRAERVIEAIINYIADITLYKPTWVTTETACCCRNSDVDYDDHKEESVPAEIKLIKYMVPVERYIGSYGHGLVGDVKIEPNGSGVLVLTLGRNLIGELTPGDTESKLKITVTSSLVNTEEWNSGKTLEFYLSTNTAGRVNNGELFDKVRIYITDHLFYEFHRGVMFDTVLSIAEENEKRLKEEYDNHGHDIHKEKHQHNKSFTADKEYNYEDTDNVKDDSALYENNDNSFQHRTNKTSGSDANDKKPTSHLTSDDIKKTNSLNHQNHQPYTSESQNDQSGQDGNINPSKESESKSKSNDKTNFSDNSSRKLQTFSLVTLLISFLFIELL